MIFYKKKKKKKYSFPRVQVNETILWEDTIVPSV